MIKFDESTDDAPASAGSSILAALATGVVDGRAYVNTYNDALVEAAAVYTGRLSSLKGLYRRAMVGLGFKVVVNH